MQPFDHLGLVAAGGDVAGVGGVAEHLTDGVYAEGTVAGGALVIDVQPLGERAVGVPPGGIHLIELADVGGSLRVWLGDAVLALDVSPREAAGEQSLTGLLP